MRTGWNLSTKLGAIGAALLTMALVSIGLTLSVTWHLEGGAAAVNEAGRLRMQTWRLAQALGSDPARTAGLIAQFDQSLAVLQAGDPARPLFLPRDARSRDALAAVQTHWRTLRATWSEAAMRPPAAVTAEAEALVATIDACVSAIEQHLARLTAILNAFQFAMVALAIASAVTLLYAAYLFVFNPLSRLQAGLARVEAGDLAVRVDVASADEFGALAASFNRMAETLQGLYGTLEARVREKTLGLERQHARLSALYEAAAFVARAATLDELARGFARQIRRAAAADAVALRWSDEANQRYFLLAADGLPADLVEAEQCLPTAQCLCGQPAGEAAMRVIPIRADAAPPPLQHCARAGYRTVVGVPVRLQERMVGELNLFFAREVLLDEDDRALLETLASHLAGAIEAQRAGALEREAAVAEERGLLARELHDSIAQSLAFLKIQVGLLRSALRRGDAASVSQTLDELGTGVQESLADVRELLLHFRTRTTDEDIVPAILTTLRKFEHQTGLSAAFEVSGQGLPLPPDVQVQVLHIVQEALSNVRKHAQAHQVSVRVSQSPAWEIIVRDDGCGFAPANGSGDDAHVGLRIMKERAARIGGTVKVVSAPGAGTAVWLSLPAEQEETHV